MADHPLPEMLQRDSKKCIWHSVVAEVRAAQFCGGCMTHRHSRRRVLHCNCSPLEFKRDHSKLQQPLCSPHLKIIFPSAPVICTLRNTYVNENHSHCSESRTKKLYQGIHFRVMSEGKEFFLLVSIGPTVPCLLRKNKTLLSGTRLALLS